MTPTRSWRVPIAFFLSVCTVLLLTASNAFATAEANIEITKSSDVTEIAAGGTITYTITVTNLGPSGASQVVVEDDVPAELTNIQISSVTQPSQCTVLSNVITCNMQGLGASGSVNTIVFTADVVGSTETGTTITNCAFELSSNSFDPDHTNDQAPFSCGQGVSVVEQADMQVVKTQTFPTPTDPATAVNGGTNVTYHIVATNNGPSTANTVTVGDTITTGNATFVSATPTAPNTNGLDCSAFLAFGDSCTVASLASGQSVAFDLVVTVPNDGTTTITDTATTSSDTSDSDSSNNSSSVTTLICQTIDLSVSKVVTCFPEALVSGPKGFIPVCSFKGGDNITYHVTVTNNDATINATNVLFTDTLPSGVSYVSDTASCSSGSVATNDCNLGTINATASAQFDIVVTANDSGQIDNTASVAADQCDSDSNNNSSTATVQVATVNTPFALEADREAATGTVSDHNRVFEPNETARVDPSWLNTLDNADPDITGAATLLTGPGDGTSATYNIVDATADYGAIPAHTASDCNTATGDCYEMQILQTSPSVRPHLSDHLRHWDATFFETLSSGETKTWSLHLGDTFLDVPRANGFYRFIETILHNHITVGCGDGTLFCPAAPTQRNQMAAFIARSLAGTDAAVPLSSGDYDCVNGPSQFTDVPTTSGFCKHVNYLRDQKVAFGCTVTEFCPNNNVTRGSMAVFIARALEVIDGNTADPDGSIPLFSYDQTGGTRQYNCTGSTQIDQAHSIPANTPPFTDIAPSSPLCPVTGLLYVRHIVDGFGDGSYHPLTNIRRDQTAKILTNAFVKLPLYGPLTF